MWSDLADKDAADALAHAPTILEEAERHVTAARHELRKIGALRDKLVESGMSVPDLDALTAVLTSAEEAMREFRDNLRSRTQLSSVRAPAPAANRP